MSNTTRYPQCHMRTALGNCDPIGGFCTSVNESICEALHKVSKPQGEWIAEYKTVEVKRGQHLGTSFRQVGWSCSNCGGGVDKAYSNCPYCLSKMTIYNSMKGANNGY